MKRPLRTMLLATIAAAALATSVGAQSSTAPKPYPRSWHWADNDKQWQQSKAAVGQDAPVLAVSNWLNGQPSKADLKNQIILYDFWATWCGPCIAAIPHTNEIMDKYASKGVKVIGVCNTRGSKKMQRVVKAKNMRYPTAADISDRTAKAYGVQWWPYYVLVDRNGKIRAAGLQPSAVENAIDKLLAEQPLPAKTTDD